MATDVAYYTNELGRIYVGRSIIRQAVEPELNLEKKFEPASSPRGSVEIASEGEGDRVSLTVHLAVAYGVNIQNEAPKVQERIKRAVEAITGLKVEEVTVNIERIFQPGEKKQPLEVKTEKEGDA